MRDRAEQLKRRIWEIRECLAAHPEMDLVRLYVYELVDAAAELARIEGKYKFRLPRRFRRRPPGTQEQSLA